MSVLRLCARRLLGTAGHPSYAAGQIRAYSSQDTAPGAQVPKCRPGCRSTAVVKRIQLLGGLLHILHGGLSVALSQNEQHSKLHSSALA